jgi:hypothetical protein
MGSMKGGVDGETLYFLLGAADRGCHDPHDSQPFKARLFALIAPPAVGGNALGVAIAGLCWGALLDFRTSPVSHV